MTSSYVVMCGSTVAQPFYLNLMFYLTFLVSAYLGNEEVGCAQWPAKGLYSLKVGSEPQWRTGTPHIHKAVLLSDVNIT